MHFLFYIALLTHLAGTTAISHAQQLTPNQVQVYVQSDTVKVDVQLDSVFTQDHIDAIESGMTASITLQLRLMGSGNNRLAEYDLNKQLEHDIWEGEYRLVRLTEPPDTLTANAFDAIRTACTDLQNIALTTLPLPDQMLTLQARVHINPITPEQQERTRRWLKILRKGSLLELFFSFRRLNPPTPWINLLQFRPAALPHLLEEGSP